MRLAAVAFESEDAILITDARGRILKVNRAFTEVTGYTEAEVIGANPNILRSGRQGEAFYQDMWSAITKTGRWSGEIWNRRKSGDIYPEWLTINSVPDVDGRIVHYVGTFKDATERKNAELALIAAKRDAEAASQAKSSFLASMSHELRTPLNAIIGFSEALGAGFFGALSDKQKEYVEDIGKQGRHLLSLVSDMLDTARIEAGRYEITKSRIDLRSTIDACLRTIAVAAKRAGLEIRYEAGIDEVPVVADERALRQVLLNLLSNAVKLTHRGGFVGVSIDARANEIAVAIRDSGIGIPKDVLPRLGRPFERVSHEKTLSNPGSGLGLAISKALVDLHGGEMTIESEIGRGTTITIHLPASR